MTRKQLVDQIRKIAAPTEQWFVVSRARTRLKNQLAAHVRRKLNKQIADPVTEAEIKAVLEGDAKRVPGLIVIDGLRHDCTENLKIYEQQMIKPVQELPIWQEWAKDIAGVGEKTLAKIITLAITQTGLITIGDYPNPAKLWKRFGLAVINGERQRKFARNPEKAILHGYSPKRRAEMYVLGDQFVKQGIGRRKYYSLKGLDKEEISEKLKADETPHELAERLKMIHEKSFYCSVYQQEKLRQLKIHPEISPKHAHNRAMRYATKRFLRDLWNVWRSIHKEGPAEHVPSRRW